MDAKKMQTVLAMLYKITVSGKDNLSYLLGCITTIESELKRAVEAQKGEETK